MRRVKLRRRCSRALTNDAQRSLDFGLIEPRFILGAQWVSCIRMSTGGAIACRFSNPPFNVKALDLPCRGARQVFLPNLLAADSLGRRQLLGKAFDIKSDHFFGIHDLSL